MQGDRRGWKGRRLPFRRSTTDRQRRDASAAAAPHRAEPESVGRDEGENIDHFCQRFGFQLSKKSPKIADGTNKVQVVPIH